MRAILSTTSGNDSNPGSPSPIPCSGDQTGIIPPGRPSLNKDLEETIDCLAEELNRGRSDHVHEVGQSVTELRD
jgi:hypothetical protein